MTKISFMMAADVINTATFIWAVVAVVPTWFGELQIFNGVATSVMTVSSLLQVYLLRKLVSS